MWVIMKSVYNHGTQYSTEQYSSDNLHSYPPDNHHSSDDVHQGEGQIFNLGDERNVKMRKYWLLQGLDPTWSSPSSLPGLSQSTTSTLHYSLTTATNQQYCQNNNESTGDSSLVRISEWPYYVYMWKAVQWFLIPNVKHHVRVRVGITVRVIVRACHFSD